MSRTAVRSIILTVAFFFCLYAAVAKPIRLRNETFYPKEKGSVRSELARTGQAQGALSGLYLFQFEASPTQDQRDQLALLGCDLLQYVPEDTFIVLCRHTPLDRVTALPGVRWVGRYKPEHKTHREVAEMLRAAAPGKPESRSVSVLLAPRTSFEQDAQVRGAFGRIRQESRLKSGTILRGQVPAGRLRALAQSDAVLWIEPDRDMKLSDEVSSKIVAGDGGPQQLLARALGYDGTGVTVAVADSGLNNGDAETMHPDLEGRTPAFFYYGSLTDCADEHSHGTHVAGIIAGNGAVGEADDNGALYGLGVAPGASIVGQRLFDGSGGYQPPPSFGVMTRDAIRAGAEIGSNSWGDDTQGRYDLSAREFDELVRDGDLETGGLQQYILEFSAGNAGPAAQTIGSPAVAKNVIATGASQNDRPDLYIYDAGIEAMADFSSRGPAEDGRIKPDVVAPGTWIASLQSFSATDQYAWAPISPFYQYQGGTSQAGPHASGMAAVLVQWFRQNYTNHTPSPALVKGVMINTAWDLDDSYDTGPIPNMDEGWGRIDLTPLFDTSLSFRFQDQTISLTNNQVYQERMLIAGPDAPLRVTLTYTDVPGFPGATRALINDLDLEVVGPDGTTYRGNQMQDSESIPDAPLTDNINNVECVILWAPAAGEYTVRVKGANVAQDARPDLPGVQQDFALVISGHVPDPHEGAMIIDRSAYRAPSTIRLLAYDADLAGQPTTSVLVRSTSEPAGETIVLKASGNGGSFTGAVATTTGPAAQNGSLQIAHGDLIEARYLDLSPGGLRTASAVADFVAPLAGPPANLTVFGKTYIQWTNNEPTTVILEYGTNTANLRAVTNRSLSMDHQVAMADVIPGLTYRYRMISTDEAGNVSTNSNNGAFFTVVPPQPRTALIVDAYTTSEFDNDIPITTYTDTLDSLGVTWEVWAPAELGVAPSAGDLEPYRLVIWRCNDGVGSTDTLTAADQNAVRTYLQNGGAFFMASMEQLTRLGNGFFRNQILKVASFNEDVGVSDIYGLPNDSLTAGFTAALSYGQYSNFWHFLLGVPDDISDTMIPSTDSAPFLVDNFTEAAGVKFPRPGMDSPGRVIFLSFPLDAVPDSGPQGNLRATVMRNALAFLAPGAGGRGTLALDAASYRLPSQMTMELGDSDLSGLGTAHITVSSTTQPAGVNVTLTETPLRGLFRGTIDLISATNTPAAGQIRAANNDTLTVRYFDASAGSNIQVTAQVDTVDPTISGVKSDPDYESAIIEWFTDEPADSIVQFGESPLLGRTASDTYFVNTHEVALSQLVPDKTYYYKVVSRDTAGNAREDDNGGQLYSFRTKKALLPPWSDNLNTGATNWTVSTSEDSQVAWTLGMPNNSMGTNNIPSPPAVWACNQFGIPVDYSESFLISPAIYLTNGNSATLRFSHNYDFEERSSFDIMEVGQLLVVNPSSAAPVVLDEFGFGSSGDWYQEEYDLTPYMGKVVYFVWFYQLLSAETIARPGWMIDDVSVTAFDRASGTLVISNNLFQAGYTLAGPIMRRGFGRGTVITNAPVGEYSITFDPVKYYNTPVNQTNVLSANGTLLLSGTYTMMDTNANSIADGWESDYFGKAAAPHPGTIDSDGDGMTDYAEFVAGTDPLNPPPAATLKAIRSGGVLHLDWTGALSKRYRVLLSTNLAKWSEFTSWMTCINTAMRFDVPVSQPAGNAYFRVEASAGGQPGDSPANLKVTSAREPDGALTLSWESVAGRAYQVQRSTNAVSWAAISEWMRAGGPNSSYSIPAPLGNSGGFYRLEVRQ